MYRERQGLYCGVDLRMRLLVFELRPFDIYKTSQATCRARMRADLLGRVSLSSMRAALSIWPASITLKYARIFFISVSYLF